MEENLEQLNKPSEDRKVNGIVDAYKLDTHELHEREDTLFEKLQVYFDEFLYRRDQRRRKRRKLQELGLHEGFDPKSTYDVKSRQIAIRNWKDFFTVYFAMIVVITGLVGFLVSSGYILNPLDEFFSDGDDTMLVQGPVQLPVVNRGGKSLRDLVDDPDDYMLIYTPEAMAAVDGRVVIVGEISNKYRNLIVRVLDSSMNVVGTSEVELTIYDNDYFPWEAIVDIYHSPSSVGGSIEVLAIDGSENEKLFTHPITFITKSTPEKITLYSPIENQILDEDYVLNILAEVNDNYSSDLLLEFYDMKGRKLYTEALSLEGSYITNSFILPDMKDWGDAGSMKISSGGQLLIELEVRYER